MTTYKKDKQFSIKLRSIAVPSVYVPTPVTITWFGKLKKRVKTFLKIQEPQRELQLSGRIHELNNQAAELLLSLKKIKDNFSSGKVYDIEKDPELSIFLEAVVDPLLREEALLYQSMHSHSIPEQAKAFKRIGLWLERAKEWVHFFDKKRSKQELIDAVVQHLVGEALTRIDRDIEIVKEYLIHQIESLGIPPEMKTRLNTNAKKAVDTHVQDLVALKKRPSKITLEGLGYWKSQIDHCRQTYFELALHSIDEIIENETPFRYNEELTEHLHEVLNETNYLERESEELLLEVLHGDLSDAAQRKVLEAHLLDLSDEAHSYMLDQRLGWDIVSRLQKVSSDIALAQQLLKEKY